MSLNTVSVRLTLEFGPAAVARPPIGSASPRSSSPIPRSRSAPPRSRCSSWSPPMRRSPMAATRSRRTWSSACAPAPARCSTCARRTSLGRIVEPRYVAMMNAMMRETLPIGTARKAQLAGLAGRRQDRHQPGFPRRLVHRLHRAPRHRRLARQRRLLADQEGDRRRPAGRNLEPVHEERAPGRAGRGAAGPVRRPVARVGIPAAVHPDTAGADDADAHRRRSAARRCGRSRSTAGSTAGSSTRFSGGAKRASGDRANCGRAASPAFLGGHEGAPTAGAARHRGSPTTRSAMSRGGT